MAIYELMPIGKPEPGQKTVKHGMFRVLQPEETVESVDRFKGKFPVHDNALDALKRKETREKGEVK